MDQWFHKKRSHRSLLLNQICSFQAEIAALSKLSIDQIPIVDGLNMVKLVKPPFLPPFLLLNSVISCYIPRVQWNWTGQKFQIPKISSGIGHPQRFWAFLSFPADHFHKHQHGVVVLWKSGQLEEGQYQDHQNDQQRPGQVSHHPLMLLGTPKEMEKSVFQDARTMICQLCFFQLSNFYIHLAGVLFFWFSRVKMCLFIAMFGELLDGD